jgi:hypothetical protein
MGRDSSVDIQTRYGLDGSGFEPQWGRDFTHRPIAAPGVHPASFAMGTGSFRVVKRPRRGVDHLTNLASRLKKEWGYTSTAPWAVGLCRVPLPCLTVLKTRIADLRRVVWVGVDSSEKPDVSKKPHLPCRWRQYVLPKRWYTRKRTVLESQGHGWNSDTNEVHEEFIMRIRFLSQYCCSALSHKAVVPQNRRRSLLSHHPDCPEPMFVMRRDLCSDAGSWYAVLGHRKQ